MAEKFGLLHDLELFYPGPADKVVALLVDRQIGQAVGGDLLEKMRPL